MKNKTYKKRPCAYCGKVGEGAGNTGDHVLPDCLYTSSVNPKIQRAKVPGCENCNGFFSKHEGHFRSFVVAAGDEPGQKPSPERKELWEGAMASFTNSKCGMQEFEEMWKQMRPISINGKLRYEIVPSNDEGVMLIVRKIFRGMAVYCKSLTYVTDAQVVALQMMMPDEDDELLETVYDIPNIATIRGREVDHGGVHSIWAMKILEVPFVGTIFTEEVALR